MYVEEKDRSWCSSNAANDNRAITIEVASDTTHPYAVNAKAYAALLDLVTDICRRNGIKKLVWSTSKNERVNHLNGCNMTVHRDYAAKACPGDYLYERHGAIAAEVNKRLGASAAEPETPSSGTGTLYKVQTGAFKQKSNAQALEKKLKAAGFDTYVVNTGGYYKVQVGAFSKKANAEAMLAKLKAAGYSDAFITTGNGGTAASVKVGSKVRLKPGAKTYDGKSLASFVYNRDHVVSELNGDRAVITYGGVTVAAVRVSDLVLADGSGAGGTIKAGSVVRVKQGAKTYTGGGLASFVYSRDHVVSELNGDRAVITYGGVTVAAVRVSDLTLVKE